MPSYQDVVSSLNTLKDPARAKVSAWFFKTGKGQYGEGDIFLGITVPEQRKIAKKYFNLPLTDIKKLLLSNTHEHRFTGLEILVAQFEKGDSKKQELIYKFYIRNSKNINNWDLVDTSAPYIVGEFLYTRPRTDLYRLAHSTNLWQKRIAIVATFAFIAKNDFDDTIKLAKIFLSDNHDLIHKAVGWALREIGKKNPKILINFLKSHYTQLPRTTLRYSIEKFSPHQRKKYLLGNFS